MLNKNKMIALLGTAAIALTLTACGNAQSGNVQAEKSASTKTAAHDVMKLSKGTFSGRSDHITTGLVTVEKTANGFQLRFADDFSLDGAPDPVVALGNGETYLVSNKLGPLKNKTGAQVYKLPADFTPGQFTQVYVWCEKFSVPLGVADLT